MASSVFLYAIHYFLKLVTSILSLLVKPNLIIAKTSSSRKLAVFSVNNDDMIVMYVQYIQ